MNRRDFLKTAGLLVLTAPVGVAALKAALTEPSLTGTAATLEMSTDDENWVGLPGASLKTQSLADYTEASDELMADAEPGVRALLDDDGFPMTLFGYPIVERQYFPDHAIFMISGDHSPRYPTWKMASCLRRRG